MSILRRGLTEYRAPRTTALLGELGITPEPWMADAVCAQTDPELFFPEKGGNPAPAKRICAVCPVTLDCLRYALANKERFGIWGGVGERDRRHVDTSDVPQRHCRAPGCPHIIPHDARGNRKYCSDDCRRAAANARYRSGGDAA